MKKSKRTKPSKRREKSGVDRISDLPDPILELILSSLPTTEELIRTSILSTRWRYLWTSIPTIDIDCSRGSKEFKKNKFKEFVYWVLLNKTQDCDLGSFRLSCSNHYSMSTIGRWIHASVMRKVKSLDLTFCLKNEDEVIELPHCLVTCDSLKVLSLYLIRRPLRMPNYTGFPALRVLKLNNVELFDDELLEAFFHSCPLLEELSLIDCIINQVEDLRISCPNLKSLILDNEKMVFYHELGITEDLYEHEGLCNGLEICCPKLVYFVYAGHITYYFSFENLDSLKTAVIHPTDMMQKELSFESMGDNICELIAGFSHVEDLALSYYFVEAIDAARDPDGNFPASFPNLKLLEIRTTIEASTLNVLIRILSSSPILESFSLIIQEEINWPEYWDLDQVETREILILTRHLKRVEFFEINGDERKLAVARFLLEHGNVLEEMVFSWCNEAGYNERSMETIKKVSEYRKACSTIKLTTLVRDW